MGIGGVNKPSSLVVPNLEGDDEVKSSGETNTVAPPSNEAAPTDTLVSGNGASTPGATAVGGAPSVTGAVNFDPEMAETTLNDVRTMSSAVGDIANATPEQMDAMVAKLLILFQTIDRNLLLAMAQNAEKEREDTKKAQVEKAEDVAEVVDLAANDNDCLAQKRLEDKLEELGYSPEEARQLSDQMTGKGVSPGQQAVLAMEAVENAPKYKEETSDPMLEREKAGGVVDSELLARLAEGENEDRKAMGKILLMLLGADENALNGSKDGPDQPGEKSARSGSSAAIGSTPSLPTAAMTSSR